MAEHKLAQDNVRRNIRLTVIGVLVFSTLTIGALVNKLSSPRILNPYQLRDYGALILDTPRPFSDFALVDQLGNEIGKQRLTGRWSILFFGFTHCADICPTTLSILATMYSALTPEDQDDLQIVLVTVDAQRDTPQRMQEYLTEFHRDFIGITGNPYAILKLAAEVNIAYDATVSADEDYQIPHSGDLVLINPEGELHGYFRPPFEHGNLRVAWRSLRATYP